MRMPYSHQQTLVEDGDAERPVRKSPAGHDRAEGEPTARLQGPEQRAFTEAAIDAVGQGAIGQVCEFERRHCGHCVLT